MMERWQRLDGAGMGLIPGAVYKQSPEDFQVTELTDVEFSGTGEHFYVFIEKINLTTRDVAALLAAAAGVATDDVGFAGMKDRQAVTRQWFSVPASRDDTLVKLSTASSSAEGLQVLETTRHSRKLRRGQLAGNRFRITLRALTAPVCRQRTALLTEQGVPNYFGPQRFGVDNLEQARRWLSRRRKVRISSFKKGLYLSVLRSFIFNEVLAERVRDASWNQLIDGDALLGDCASGPLWGRGRSAVSGRAAELQNAALAPHAQLLEDLEYAGVSQQQRAFVLKPGSFELHQGDDDSLTLSFELGPGAYATVVLRELVALQRSHTLAEPADANRIMHQAVS